jgi:pyruvate dehydrogenase E1 component alpha subunit
VTAVAAAVGQAADRARAGAGPALLEAVTYRHFGHSRTDPAKYRPAEEVEQWLRRDPLTVARGLLAAAGAAPQTVDAAAERARQVVAAAVEEARRAPAADPGQALTDVWADGGAAWRT